MMKHVSNIRGGLLVALAVTLATLSACAVAPPKTQQVEQRAMARWDAYFAGDLAAAYEFLTPGTRSSVSLMQYQRSVFLNKINWTEAKFIESDCAETTCKVKISIKYTVIGAVPGLKSFTSSQVVEESWLLVNGNWYLVLEN